MDNVTYYSEKNIICLLLVPHAIFSVIATVFVGLRIYTGRRVTKTPWQMDEYISIAALVGCVSERERRQWLTGEVCAAC